MIQLDILKKIAKKSTAIVFLLLLAGFGTAQAQYCNPSFTYGCSSADYIQSFSTSGGLTNISNPNTGCAVSSGLSFYLSQVLTCNPGQVINYTVTNTPSFGEYYAIFIDLNGDGDLVDAGEQVVGFPYLTGGQTYTSTFTIPVTANAGLTRMRVMCVYATSSFVPCGSYAFGEIEDYSVQITSPCPKPTSLPATVISSMAAQINWNPLGGSLKYDYIVDSTTPGKAITAMGTTTGTNAYVTGLKPGSVHYARVRSYCTATGFSLWDTMMFQTLPPCNTPSGFVASNIDSNSANFTWGGAANVLQYQYVVNTNRNNPTSSTPFYTTTSTFVALPDTCKDGMVYYVHIRAKCVANDSSGWSLDSFRTPVPCRAPQLSTSYLTSDNAIVVWAKVPTAYNYEYYLGTIATIPANGTPIVLTNVQMPYLQPSTGYTLNVRAMCNDFGIKTNSSWASLDFATKAPAAVAGLNSEKGSIRAYPNPVKETLTVEVMNSIDGKGVITITDVAGKTLRTVPVTNAKTDVSMSALPAGFYQLKYTDDKHADIINISKQ
jgi:hypothetical protein